MPARSCLRAQLDRGIVEYVLPGGLLMLLTGMFWSGSTPTFHKIYYAFFVFPTFLAFALNPARFTPLWQSPVFRLFLAFSALTLASILWSDTGNPFSSLAKRPLYVTFLFAGIFALAAHNRVRLALLPYWGGLLAALAALVSVACFFMVDEGELGHRFPGYGALDNPLLTSHVYGMFATVMLVIALLHREKRLVAAPAFLILFILILLTGSRTPLAGFAMAILWFAFLRGTHQGRWAILALVLSGCALMALYPAAILERGFSYRPEIWAQALQKIAANPWLGYGYDSSMKFCVASTDYCFNDTHNLVLAVFYSTGIAGGILWLALLSSAQFMAWKARGDDFVVIASAALTFGITAGMTEGIDFLSRPKEHWFLIWIPLAILCAALAFPAQSRKDPH